MLNRGQIMTGRVFSLRLVGFLLAATAFPVGGQATEQKAGATAGLAELSNDQLLQRLQEAYNAKDSSACRDMVPVLAEVVRRKSFDPSYGPFKLRLDLQCAVDERRYDDAYSLLGQNEKVNGEVVPAIAAVMIATQAKQYDNAVDRFVAAAGKPANEGGLPDSSTNLRWLDGKLTEADRHDLALSVHRRFVRTAAFRALVGREKEYVQEMHFRHEVEAGNIDAARPLLANIRDTELISRLLADRRYETLWIDFERVVGPNMATLLNANVEKATDALRRDPDNHEKLSDLAKALSDAGRYDDVLTLTADLVPPVIALTALDEHQYWALESRVNALDGLGHGAEADALYDAMAGVPFEVAKNGWLVNFVANRSARLADKGDWEKTLLASERAAFVANQYGTPYARQIIASNRACALAGLGRKSELDDLIARMDAKYVDAPASTALAMECAGRGDRAAEIVIEALREPDSRTNMLSSLQGQEFSFLAMSRAGPDVMFAIRQRPDVAAIFEKFGRDLPRSLVPPAGQRWLDQQKAAAKPGD